MEKNFLIVDGVLVEDMESGSLKIYRKDLDVYIRMISGRQVCEKRGWYWVIEADFSDIDTELMERLDAVLMASTNHIITFLPSNGSAATVTGTFHLTSRPAPALKSWQEELPEWSGLSYVFEEVRPHD